MILYKIGDINIKINWDNFLILETSESKYYRSDFIDFPEMYKFLDENLKHIKYLKFDGFEYYLNNGLLHNLWGPAKIVSVEGGFGDGFCKRFFINGEIVWYKGIHCKNMKNFESGEIYFYEKLTDGAIYRIKEKIDYNLINLEKLREKELRKNKIEKIENSKG